MPSGQPPPVLRIAAALCIAYGAVAVVGMLASLIQGRFWFDLGFVGILIGKGLLEGRASARTWGLVLSGAGLIFWIFLSIQAFYSGSLHASLRDNPWLNAASWLLTTLVYAIVFFGLRISEVKRWFSATSPERVTDNGWVIPIFLVAAVFSAEHAMEGYGFREALENSFPVHSTFKFIDEKTGSPIMEISCPHPALSTSTAARDPLAPRIQLITTGGEDGVCLQLIGVSVAPLELTFFSPGYTPVTHTLNKKSPEVVTLRLQQLPL